MTAAGRAHRRRPPLLDALGAHRAGRPSGPIAHGAGALGRGRAGGDASIVAVVEVGQSPTARHGRALGRQLADGAVDVVLVSRRWPRPRPTRWPLIDALPGVPVVIWALHETGPRGWRLRPRRHHHPGRHGRGADAHQHAVADAAGRSSWCWAGVDDPAVLGRVREALRLAARRLAGSAARGWVASAGRSTGYPHVDVRRRRAAGRRPASRSVSSILTRSSMRWRAVGPTRRRARSMPRSARSWTFEGDVDARRVARAQPAGGAGPRGCRGRARAGWRAPSTATCPQFRFGETIGIAPCWGLGRLTTDGRPFTCTGDILTAVAMLTTKRLGGAALYHEIEAIDYATGEVVIANCGEHDLAWLAPGERPRLRPNGWFCGKDAHCGVCAVLEPRAGTGDAGRVHAPPRCPRRFPARGRARRALTPRAFPETGTANGAFRFRDGTVEEAWARWAATGVNHHSSATPGDLSGEVERSATGSRGAWCEGGCRELGEDQVMTNHPSRPVIAYQWHVNGPPRQRLRSERGRNGHPTRVPRYP